MPRTGLNRADTKRCIRVIGLYWERVTLRPVPERIDRRRYGIAVAENRSPSKIITLLVQGSVIEREYCELASLMHF